MPMPKVGGQPSEPDRVWIKTYPDPLGERYHAEISYGEDTVVPLTPEDALQWADAVMGAVAAAEYDAAVWAQLTKLLDESPMGDREKQEAIGQVVVDLRQDRRERYGIADLELEPGVTLMGKPFLTASIRGERIGQWGMQAAREHVLMALEVAYVAKFDTDYLRALTTVIGLDRPRAMAMIEGLGQHR